MLCTSRVKLVKIETAYHHIYCTFGNVAVLLYCRHLKVCKIPLLQRSDVFHMLTFVYLLFVQLQNHSFPYQHSEAKEVIQNQDSSFRV